MSNLKIKKSKILLIILCLLALVFSYSCSCRNNSTGPKWEDDDKKGDSSIFSLTENKSQANNLLIYSTKLGKTNSLVIVKYEEQADNEFYAELNLEDDGSTGLTANMFDYKSVSGELTLNNDGIDKVKNLTGGEIKEIKIKFTFTPKKQDLTVKGETEFTHTIRITKTKILHPKDAYGKAIETVGGGAISVNSSTPGIGKVTFNTENTASGATDSGTTIKAAGDGDTGTLNIKEFKNAFNNDSKNRNFDNFSSVMIIDDGTIAGTTASFTVQFTLKDESLELDAGDGTFMLDVDISRNYNSHKDTVKWE